MPCCWGTGFQQVGHTFLLKVILFQHFQAQIERLGVRGGAVGWAGRSQALFPMVSLELCIEIILPATLWRWGRLSGYQKWVPGIFFLGGKGGRCLWLTTLPPSYANYLEVCEPLPPGTLRVCAGLYRDWFTQCGSHPTFRLQIPLSNRFSFSLLPYLVRNVVALLTMKGYRGVETELHLFLTWVLDGVGQLHAPAALTPRKEPRYPLSMMLDGPQGQFERIWEERNILFQPRIELRFLGRSTYGLVARHNYKTSQVIRYIKLGFNLHIFVP
jgi:hypothetical protein